MKFWEVCSYVVPAFFSALCRPEVRIYMHVCHMKSMTPHVYTGLTSL